MDHFPIEKYIDLENNPYLVGRISVHNVKQSFYVEVDIIHRESHKIFKHIEILYNQNSAEEAIITGVQKLRQFLDLIERKGAKSDSLH